MPSTKQTSQDPMELWGEKTFCPRHRVGEGGVVVFSRSWGVPWYSRGQGGSWYSRGPGGERCPWEYHDPGPWFSRPLSSPLNQGDFKLREAKPGGFQTPGVSHFFGKGPDCVADPSGTVPRRCS